MNLKEDPHLRPKTLRTRQPQSRRRPKARRARPRRVDQLRNLSESRLLIPVPRAVPDHPQAPPDRPVFALATRRRTVRSCQIVAQIHRAVIRQTISTSSAAHALGAPSTARATPELVATSPWNALGSAPTRWSPAETRCSMDEPNAAVAGKLFVSALATAFQRTSGQAAVFWTATPRRSARPPRCPGGNDPE